LIHVRDFAAAACVALDAGEGILGKAIEVDDGHPGGYSWQDLAEAAGRATGRALRPLRIPPAAIRIAGAGGAFFAGLRGQVPTLSPGKVREILHPDWVCRDRDLERSTGWHAAIELSEGFAETFAWYRARGWL